MQDLFVSHASADADIARQVVEALESNDVTCWIAPRDMRPGEEYQAGILSGLRNATGVLLLYSGSAAASKHVAREIGLADDQGKPIYILRIVDAPLTGSLEYILASRQWIDFWKDPDTAIVRLIEALPTQRAIRMRSRVWQIPESSRATMAKAIRNVALSGIAFALVAAPATYIYFSHTSAAQCAMLASSELQVETTTATGLPLTLVDPARAIPACESATFWNRGSARATFQYARALDANGYARATEVYGQAAALGYPEAVLEYLLRQQPRNREEMAIAALEQISGEVLSGNERAKPLLAQMVRDFSSLELESIDRAIASVLSAHDFRAPTFDCRAEDFECQVNQQVAAMSPASEHFSQSLFRSAADAGHMYSLMQLGEDGEARAAEFGYLPAVFKAQGETQARSLAEAGYRPAMIVLAFQLLEQGEHEDAQRWFARAAPYVESEN